MHYARTISVAGRCLDQARWQPLAEHLANVGASASSFADQFGAAEWGMLAGLWHDLGKYHPDFQEMLQRSALGLSTERVDHSSAGAVHVGELLSSLPENLRALLAFPIAGHHAGLADGQADLKARLTSDPVVRRYQGVQAEQPAAEILIPRSVLEALAPPPQLQSDPASRALRSEFLLRMIFSALVDADRLDAERAQDSVLPRDRQVARFRESFSSIAQLRDTLDLSVDSMVAAQNPAFMAADQRRLFAYRQEVLKACRDSAELAPGAFFLDVATGGGKTLSSLSFALRHAARHGKRRVVVVIPYTSIIEQTTAVYRSALGALAENVVEHHSAVSEPTDVEAPSEAAERRRLATENWDAPVIVTTAVQFFESLFACKPSKCRKLHNICNSVIVVDEAQTLPPKLLHPTIWALNELIEGYGCSIVLSTATQPALEAPFPALRQQNIRARIAPAPPPPRARVEVLADEPLDWPALAQRLATHDRVLCITHRRDDARDLTLELDRVLGDESCFHLSANMCAAHRSVVIGKIRQRLSDGHTCRVVSTQLVEAGVDLDFPVVYRALAGVDSLVQAAGRCNREGKLGERGGLLRVYRAPTKPPPGLPRISTEVANTLLAASTLDGDELDLFAPQVGRAFFRDYFRAIGQMDSGITPLRRELKFKQVAEAYRFIEDGALTFVPRWGKAPDIVEQLRSGFVTGKLLRALQPFTVSIYELALHSLLAKGAAEALFEGDEERFVQSVSHRSVYSDRFGLDLSAANVPDGEALIV